MEGSSRKLRWIFGLLLALVLLGAGTYLFFGGYERWIAFFEERKQAREVADIQQRIEEAYRNDTYGGKTPQETLDLFVQALRAGDVELASKYFALDDNLSREKWYQALVKAKDEGRLTSIADEIELKAVPSPRAPLYENDFQYVIYGSDGMVDVTIDMELNPLSKIWKIESL